LWLVAVLMRFISGAAILIFGRLFGGNGDYRQAARTSAFISTPGWLINIFGPAWRLHFDNYNFTPSPSVFLFIGAAWGIYLLWRALPSMTNTPPGKSLLATGAIALALTALWAIAFMTTYGIISSLMGSYMAAAD
jgi:hypothetical protein